MDVCKLDRGFLASRVCGCLWALRRASRVRKAAVGLFHEGESGPTPRCRISLHTMASQPPLFTPLSSLLPHTLSDAFARVVRELCSRNHLLAVLTLDLRLWPWPTSRCPSCWCWSWPWRRLPSCRWRRPWRCRPSRRSWSPSRRWPSACPIIHPRLPLSERPELTGVGGIAGLPRLRIFVAPLLYHPNHVLPDSLLTNLRPGPPPRLHPCLREHPVEQPCPIRLPPRVRVVRPQILVRPNREPLPHGNPRIRSRLDCYEPNDHLGLPTTRLPLLHLFN